MQEIIIKLEPSPEFLNAIRQVVREEISRLKTIEHSYKESEAMKILGVGRTTLYNLEVKKVLMPVREGRSKRWLASDLDHYQKNKK